jgi:hypothetical protein
MDMPKDIDLNRSNRNNANSKATEHYKEKKSNARTMKKAKIQTYKAQAQVKNEEIKEINKIIKKQGYYVGPTISDYSEKKLKKISYKQLMKENELKIEEPKIPIAKVPFLVKLRLFFGKIGNSILNFFVNLPSRRIYSPTTNMSSTTPNPTAGLNQKGIKDIEPEMQMVDKLEIFEQQSRQRIDINKEFQHWQTEHKINNIAPSDMLFDFIKSAILEGFITDEKGVTDIFSYAFENVCEYNAEKDNLTMFFSTKQPQGIAAFSVDNTGKISCPTNFMYKGKEYTNVVKDINTAKIPIKVQTIADNLKKNPELLYSLVNETQYSQTNLEQVRTFVNKTGLSEYLPHIDAVEQKFNDKNAIKALNQFVVKASFLEGLSPRDVMDLAFIGPSIHMANMMNPSQYKEIYPFVENTLIKGYTVNEAFRFGELLKIRTEEGKTLQSPENREKIMNHIENLEKLGFNYENIVDIVSIYNEEKNPELMSLNIAFINYEISNGKTINELTAITEMNTKGIADKITEEMNCYTNSDIQDDIKNNTQKTMISVYIQTLTPETLEEVTNHLDDNTREIFVKLANPEQDISDIVLNGNKNNGYEGCSQDEPEPNESQSTIDTDSEPDVNENQNDVENDR